MKRLFVPLFAALLCSACGPSNDRLIDQYEKAINEENYGEARRILDKIDENKLTEEQSARILDISTGGAYGTLEEQLLRSMNRLGKTMNGAMSDERVDRTLDAVDSAVDDALDDYDESLDEMLGDDD